MERKLCPECSTIEALKEASKEDWVSTQCCSDECAERRYMRFAEGKEPPKKTRDIELSTKKLVLNRARCTECEDVITSRHVHDFVSCKCGAIHVDGGLDYLKRCGDLDCFIELSEWEVE